MGRIRNPRHEGGLHTVVWTSASWVRRALIVGLALLMAWSSISFFRESHFVWTRIASREVLNIRTAGRWLPGARQVLALKRFLDEVDATVPPGEAIAFDARTDEAQRLYVYLWAAYFLPGRDIVPLAYPNWNHQANYVALYDTAAGNRELELVERFERGALLRLRR